MSDVWFVSIIFALTLLGGFRVTSWAASTRLIVPQVEEAPSDVQDLLSRAAALERGPVTSDLDTFWGPGRFARALNAPDSERDAFAAFVGRLEQITPDALSPPGAAE